jgi:hypothetical protein
LTYGRKQSHDQIRYARDRPRHCVQSGDPRLGRLINLCDWRHAYIGFTKRELKRRDVARLISGQRTREVCTEGASLWFQARIWFEIDDEIGEAEWREFERRHKKAWEARYGASPK